MAFLQKKGINYYLCEKVKLPGIPVKWTTKWIKLGDISASDAKICLSRYHTEKNYLRLDVQGSISLTLNELSDRYIEFLLKLALVSPDTIKNRKWHLKNIGKQFGSLHVHKINHIDVERWLYDKKITPNSFRFFIHCLSECLKFGIRNHWVKENFALKIKKPKLEKLPPKYASNEDISKMLSVANNRQKTFIKLLLYTGMRPSEMLRLKPVNFDTTKNVINLFTEQTKTKRARSIPIHGELSEIVMELIKGEKNRYIFGGEEPQKEVKMVFRRACAAYNKVHKDKIHITPYQMRHTCATNLLNAGVDIRTVQEILGHTSIMMTARYATPKQEIMKKAIDLL